MAMMKKQRPSNASSLDDDNKTVTGENDPDSGEWVGEGEGEGPRETITALDWAFCCLCPY